MVSSWSFWLGFVLAVFSWFLGYWSGRVWERGRQGREFRRAMKRMKREWGKPIPIDNRPHLPVKKGDRILLGEAKTECEVTAVFPNAELEEVCAAENPRDGGVSER